MSKSTRPFRLHARIALTAAALLGPMALPALAQAPQRAAAAAARGDLRTAQIEWRNAIRQDPNALAPRLSLIAVSLELGDGETAEREARAALARGLDPALGHNLLVRAFLLNGRHEELLTALPQPQADPGGQVAAGRAQALLATNQREAARASVQLALSLAPDAPEPLVAAAALAQAEGDRAAAEALVDRALAAQPQHVDGLMRKAMLALERGDPREAVTWLDRTLAVSPSLVPALLRRAELRRMTNEPELMRRDVDAALAIQPNSAGGLYLRAMLAVQAQDWAVADAALQRIGPALGAFPGGFLLLASVKRGMGQEAQALDAAQRHQARWPDDARAARLIAALHLAANRPQDAAAALTEFAARGGADAASLDLLGRLHTAAGRRQEAIAAFQAAAAQAPDDSEIQTRLAAARMANGDVIGSMQAASEALRRNPELDGAQELLAFAALYRGDVAGVMAALERLTPAARQTEPAGVLLGSVHMLQLKLDAAKAAFQEVLRQHPSSLAARLGLVRVHLIEADLPAAERLLAEALRLDPGNAEAIGQLARLALPPSPRAAQARQVMETAQAAAPNQPALALGLAQVLLREGQAARALGLLRSEVLARQPNPNVAMLRAEAHAALAEWPAAEAASREALGLAPQATGPRVQLASVMLRAGDGRGARIVLEQGLRERPADPQFLRNLVIVVRDAQGLDAALELADRLGREPRAQPVGATLRGELLLGAQRPAEAARAFAAAQAVAPSSLLVQRMAAAWREAGQPAQAAQALRDWLRAQPGDDAALLMLSNLDIEAGRLAEARQRLEELLTRQPDNPLVMNNLAWLLVRRGQDESQLGRAQVLAQRAYFLAPGSEVADTLGWTLARSGRPADALPLLRQGVPGAGRPNPGATYRLAYALAATGARAEALALLEPALEPPPATFPEQAEARQLLAELRGASPAAGR